MDAVRQWAFAVCSAMVIGGIVRMVLPASGLEKMFRVTVSLFFLCCLLSPVVLRNPEIRLQVREYSQQEIDQRARRLQEVVEQQSQRAAQAGVEKIIVGKLAEMGINYRRITININTNGQSGQEPASAEIVLEAVHREAHSEIAAALRETLGLPVQLEYE